MDDQEINSNDSISRRIAIIPINLFLSWTVITHTRRHHHCKKLDLLVDRHDDQQLYQSDQKYRQVEYKNKAMRSHERVSKNKNKLDN